MVTQARMSGTRVGGMFDARIEGTAGLTGVWAEENTRASIFEAMQRKGVRVSVVSSIRTSPPMVRLR